MSKKNIMHVISGTHWDREWRHTAEQSKPRLCELIDIILNTLEKKDSYETFCLDGGQVVLEDYLEIHPENRERVKKLVQDGRITLVNWYTLPDTFTVAAEAMLRNLKLGQKMAEEFGGAMKSGYTATSYGQTSQLPQIYQGFNITNAIFYRGTNKYLLDPLFLWKGADGSDIHVLRTFDEVTRTNWFFYMHQPLVLDKEPADLAYYYDKDHIPTHMCDTTLYERGFSVMKETPSFNTDPEAIKKAFKVLVDQAKPYAVGKHILALNMEDNDAPFELLPEMIEAVNKVSGDIELRQSSMDQYMKAITDDTDKDKLPVHQGELRIPAVEHGFNGLLGATHSSRIKLKVLNERAENGLIYHAEPLAAMASVLGDAYPKTYLDRAWKHLLLNQAHDSICGAAVDHAHEDMLYNFSVSTKAGEEITARSAFKILKNLNTSKDFEPSDHTFTFFNTLAHARKEVVEVVIDLPKQATVEGVIDPCTGQGASSGAVEYFDIIDTDGNDISYEILDKQDIQIGVERELDTKGIKMPAVRRRILLTVEVPSMGYRTYAMRPRGPKYIAHPEKVSDRKLMAREDGVLENEHIKVKINSNGTFDMLHKASSHEMKGLHYYTDNGEIGSAHLSAYPKRNFVRTTLGKTAEITLMESNEHRGVYRIDLEITVPAAATPDGRDRFRENKTIPITTWLTLKKDAKHLQVKTKLHNEARDHRLRVNFPSNIKTDTVDVESAFAVETRNILWTETGDNFEKCYEYQPMQNFLDLSDGKIGLAVLNRGLREYEIKDDAARTIAITLLRTQRAYMTANSVMTPDELDQYIGQHSFGTLEYEYALYPHTGNWTEAEVTKASYDFKVDINAILAVPHSEGKLPATGSFISVDSDKLMLACFKQADDGEGFILRFWNISDDSVDATIDINLPVTKAYECKLNEEIVSEFKLDSGKIKLTSGAHKIHTILLKS